MACAACIASLLAAKGIGRARPALLLAGAVACGMLSHIVLDITPHYAWIVYLDFLGSEPYSGVLKELVTGSVVIVICLLLVPREHLPAVVAGIIGSAYLDAEKVAALGLGLPHQFVIFDWHSLQVAAHWTGVSSATLIAWEVAIFIVCMAILVRIRFVVSRAIG